MSVIHAQPCMEKQDRRCSMAYWHSLVGDIQDMKYNRTHRLQIGKSIHLIFFLLSLALVSGYCTSTSSSIARRGNMVRTAGTTICCLKQSFPFIIGILPGNNCKMQEMPVWWAHVHYCHCQEWEEPHDACSTYHSLSYRIVLKLLIWNLHFSRNIKLFLPLGISCQF